MQITETPKITNSTAKSATQVAMVGDGMGKDDFLKLFVAQLSHQDPMNPMQDAEFMGQMASFSTLEQITNLSKVTENLAASQAVGQSVALIGREVSYTDAEGAARTGKVEKVTTNSDGTISLTIAGVTGIAPADLTEVS